MFEFYKDTKKKVKESQKQLDNAVIYDLKTKDTEYGVDESRNQAPELNKKLVVEDKRMTTKKFLAQTYRKNHAASQNGYDPTALISKENMESYASMEAESEITAEKEQMLKDYSKENKGRVGKTRKKHAEKTNQYARQIQKDAREYDQVAYGVKEYRERDLLHGGENFKEEVYAKMFKKKFAMDIQMIDTRYKLDKHAIKVGGNKDGEEKGLLLHLKYVNLASKLAVARQASAEAVKYPNFLDKNEYDKMCAKIEKEMKKLEASYTDDMLAQKAHLLVTATEQRTKAREEKAKNVKLENESKKVLAEQGPFIEEVKAELLQAGDEEERQWRQETITARFIATVIARNVDTIQMIKMNNDGEFKNYKEAVKLLCESQLHYSATEVSTTDHRKLLKGGMTERDIKRMVDTQMRPVRRLKNGEFVSAQDEQNYQWNQKWIKAVLSNDEKLRQECIEENLLDVKDSYVPNVAQMENADYLIKNFRQIIHTCRVMTGFDNLKNDELSSKAAIHDFQKAFAEVKKKYPDPPKYMTDLGEWSYGEMMAGYYQMLTNAVIKIYSVNMMNNVMERANGVDTMETYLRTCINQYMDAYKKAGNL